MAKRVEADLPWVDRHKPKHLGQVVGNTDQVRKLAEWLRDWDDVVLKGKTKEAKPEPGKEWQKFKPVVENINARACLVSGPPGIGKTTTATLVARCCKKYKVMEFNASDARTKVVIEGMSKSLAGNHTLRLSPGGGAGLERAIIIMDECDGMSGGGDKGGMQALINMVKTTKNPIICICNDRSDTGVRSLAQSCYDMKFKRPDNSAVAKRVRAILEGQGKKVNMMALEATIEACGQDIRQVLNQVQFFGQPSGTSQKDSQVSLSPFDACQTLLSKGDKNKKAIPFDKKMDLYYIDADLMPLMIQENYLRCLEKGPRSGETEAGSLEACAKAAESMAIADSMASNFELGNSVGVIGTIYPAFLCVTDSQIPIRASFPAWLQRRTPQVKNEKMVHELHSKLQGHSSCSGRSLVTTSFCDLLHRRLLQPLNCGDSKGCAAALFAFGLNREFFTEQMPALRQPLGFDDGYKRVEARSKQQLLQDLQELQAMVTKRKRQDGGTGSGRGNAFSAGRGSGSATVNETDDGDEANESNAKKLKKGSKKREKGGNAACSLHSWVQKPVVDGADCTEEKSELQKSGALVLKFIEGFTNAVRRKVHMKELLGPWNDF